MKLVIDCGTILSLGFVKTIKALTNPLRTNRTKWSNTLKQFVDFCQLLRAARCGAYPLIFAITCFSAITCNQATSVLASHCRNLEYHP